MSTTPPHASGVPVWCGGMLETGIGRATNLALASMPNFLLPGDTSASARYFPEDLTEPFVLESRRDDAGADRAGDRRGSAARAPRGHHRSARRAPPVDRVSARHRGSSLGHPRRYPKDMSDPTPPDEPPEGRSRSSRPTRRRGSSASMPPRARRARAAGYERRGSTSLLIGATWWPPRGGRCRGRVLPRAEAHRRRSWTRCPRPRTSSSSPTWTPALPEDELFRMAGKFPALGSREELTHSGSTGCWTRRSRATGSRTRISSWVGGEAGGYVDIKAGAPSYAILLDSADDAAAARPRRRLEKLVGDHVHHHTDRRGGRGVGPRGNEPTTAIVEGRRRARERRGRGQSGDRDRTGTAPRSRPTAPTRRSPVSSPKTTSAWSTSTSNVQGSARNAPGGRRPDLGARRAVRPPREAAGISISATATACSWTRHANDPAKLTQADRERSRRAMARTRCCRWCPSDAYAVVAANGVTTNLERSIEQMTQLESRDRARGSRVRPAGSRTACLANTLRHRRPPGRAGRALLPVGAHRDARGRRRRRGRRWLNRPAAEAARRRRPAVRSTGGPRTTRAPRSIARTRSRERRRSRGRGGRGRRDRALGQFGGAGCRPGGVGLPTSGRTRPTRRRSRSCPGTERVLHRRAGIVATGGAPARRRLSSSSARAARTCGRSPSWRPGPRATNRGRSRRS